MEQWQKYPNQAGGSWTGPRRKFDIIILPHHSEFQTPTLQPSYHYSVPVSTSNVLQLVPRLKCLLEQFYLRLWVLFLLLQPQTIRLIRTPAVHSILPPTKPMISASSNTIDSQLPLLLASTFAPYAQSTLAHNDRIMSSCGNLHKSRLTLSAGCERSSS